MANEWSKLVKKVYHENKHKAGYKLQNAMKDAKKYWKGSNNKSVKKHHGSRKHRHQHRNGTRKHHRHH